MELLKGQILKATFPVAYRTDQVQRSCDADVDKNDSLQHRGAMFRRGSLPGIQKKAFLRALCIATVALSAVAQQTNSPGMNLRPAMLVWNVGVDSAGDPSRLVETITTANWEGQKTWRVTHYPQDPANSKINDYDIYDLDRTSLAPLRSISSREDGWLELRFSKAGVAIRSKTESADWSEHVDLHTAVQSEGPGLTAFVATLPLKAGYRLDYELVDRWSGRNNTRIKKMRLEVKSRRVIETVMGKKDSYEVSIQPDDRSFEIREFVVAQGLHWPLQMTYIRGATRVNSAVIALAVSER